MRTQSRVASPPSSACPHVTGTSTTGGSTVSGAGPENSGSPFGSPRVGQALDHGWPPPLRDHRGAGAR
ncbi:hypothetical protein BJ968_004438 [Kineococcus aurantiacus]|uniref:Uncharacterized protein n=1 Tax=Kineococcus aurantiacus TaxID=37633 RepID=A0A7Y9DQM6_9ACTN|nr:hypothetical protein [Kineococcus aurantiacus]